jgi:hypothetical protein
MILGMGKHGVLQKNMGGSSVAPYDGVIIEYLQAGDARPLVDLILRGGAPGSGVLIYLAAMVDRDLRSRLKTDFEFHSNC